MEKVRWGILGAGEQVEADGGLHLVRLGARRCGRLAGDLPGAPAG